MAQRVTVELQDDIDGGPADETLRFGLSGTEYEIDLSKKNASTFRRRVAPYIEHARKAGRGQRRRPVRTASAGSAAPTSGRGRKIRASRSASAGASRRALSSSTKPPQ
jgi:Lsr2